MSNESVIGTTIPITPAEALNKSPAPAAEETAEQPAGEKEKVKKSVAAKKLEKRIMRLTGQAIADFNMIGSVSRYRAARTAMCSLRPFSNSRSGPPFISKSWP